MREEKIIQFLKNNPSPQPLAELAQAFGVSKRTIANDLKAINELGKQACFQVMNVRGKGYRLDISNEGQFEQYFNQLADNPVEGIMDPQERKLNIELLLLFANEYVTLNQIAETLDVSPSTVKSDLAEVKQDFAGMNLQLTSKAHYGYRISGAEENQRLFIIQLLRKDLTQPVFTPEYQAFSDRFDTQKLKAFLVKRVADLQIRVNDLVLDNLVQHIFLLVFRIKQHNLLKEQTDFPTVQTDYTQLAADIADYIAEHEQVQLTQNEQLYLSRQLFGKIVTLNDVQQHQALATTIEQALAQIDHKYQTDFLADQELIDALTLHVAPLLQRLYVGRQLENPIIDDVYTRYANVFNIAFEFIEAIRSEAKLTLSKDEAGYLAIYFAASLEKQLQQAKDRYRKIAVICATGGGASYFAKIKLEQIFANAQVETFALAEVQKIDATYDLIITTVPLEAKFTDIPVIQTHALLTEKELKQIQQDLLLIQDDTSREQKMARQILALFSAEHFHVTNETDYLGLLKKHGEQLEQTGWAANGYSELVLEREKLVDTIYHKGVAGPHPMESKAEKECIDLIICQEGCEFNGKQVRLIFLINISNRHLVLHKELSHLMIQLMEDPQLDEQLATIKEFDQFLYYMKELIERG